MSVFYKPEMCGFLTNTALLSLVDQEIGAADMTNHD